MKDLWLVWLYAAICFDGLKEYGKNSTKQISKYLQALTI